MFFNKDFFLLFTSDFTLRYGYQIGKMPLLPYFAMTLGASEILIGTILSISTITGIFLKPVVGFFSDQSGRKVWLLVASIFFILFPFLYLYVSTPAELTVIRILHGTATAILGPVSLALVSDLSNKDSSTAMGIFGMARSASYLLAPITAGMILHYFSLETGFYTIGAMSLIGSFPLLLIQSDYKEMRLRKKRIRDYIKIFFEKMVPTLKKSFLNFDVWRAALLEFLIYFVTYSIKVFLPLRILTSDPGTFIKAGAYLTLQELSHFLIRPVGGKLGDVMGEVNSIRTGLIIIVISLINLAFSQNNNLLFFSAVLFGTGQAFVLPASLSLIVKNKNVYNRGSEMGVLGSIRNLGKILGPIASGFLLIVASYQTLFLLLAILISSYIFFQVKKKIPDAF